MNLYLRLLWTLLRCWREGPIDWSKPLQRRLRVLPNDLDVNGHMNNGRYLTIVDLLLVEYFVRSGFARHLIRHRWRPMSGGSLITFRRGLAPFAVYTVTLERVGGDEFWNYLRFKFEQGDRLCAAGFTKGAAVGKSGLVAVAESVRELGWMLPDVALPDGVAQWRASERTLTPPKVG